MRMHFCKEEPCSVQEREYAKIIEEGFETYYTNMEGTNLIDVSHTCTCPDFHWQTRKVEDCRVHGKKK